MNDTFVFESEPMTFEALQSMSGYGSSGGFLEREYDFEGGGTTAVVCGSYQPDEVRKSNTEAGHLPSDFFAGPSGYYLIADFAVASSTIKRSVPNDPNLKNWLNHQLQAAAKDPRMTLTIVGYTDCANKENRNINLRAARARAVRRLLEQLAGRHPGWRFLKGRIKDGPAPVDQYLRDNSNPTNRAVNRGVSLEVKTVVTMEPLPANCRADLLYRAKNLLRAPRTQQLMGSKLGRIRHILDRVNDKTTDDRYVTEAEVTTVARYGIRRLTWRRVSKYFDDVCATAERNNAPITDDHIIHELMRLDNGFMNGICRLLEFKQNRATTRMKASVVALTDTVWGFMKKPTSVYYGYQTAERECPTRSKPVVIPPPKRKDPKDPQGGTPPQPDPKNQIVPTDHSIWDDLKRIAKMSGILISAAMLLIPGAVVARAVLAARAVFLLRGFTARQLVGMAGEAAARVIAEYTLTRAGIPVTRIFNLNTIRMNFPGIDLITPLRPISVKAYGIITRYTGDELNRRVLSRYLSDFLKLAGSESYQEKYRIRVANGILQAKKTISQAGALPSGLSGNIGVNTVMKYMRDETIFMIPSDHVVLFHKYAGSRLLTYYKQFGLPGIPPGLTDNAVAPRISKMLADRFQSMGVKSTDLQLMLKAAQK